MRAFTPKQNSSQQPALLQRPTAVTAVPDHQTEAEVVNADPTAAHVAHDFSRVPVHAALPPVQRKPAVSSPGDPFEREADEAADKVMRLAQPAPTGLNGEAPEDEEALIRTRPAASASGGAALDTEAALTAAGRAGAPLPAMVRSYFEPRFGYDFSGVRVHMDGEAAVGAQAVQARAYTIGSDIVFGAGEYAPATAQGKRLIAHELAHVVQQAQGPPQVQRFTEPGHKMIGDEAYGSNLLTLGPGLQVTFGDAVAMGDYFGSFEKMKRLAEKPGKGPGTQGEVRYVLWVKIREKPVDEKMGKWYDKYAVQVRDQAESFLRGTNISHFPNPLAGDTALNPLQKNQRVEGDMPFGAMATYRRGHEKAMQMAYDHGVKQEAMDDAILADAFACHFLTDSFSASHARTPRASIKAHWDKLVPGFQRKLIGWLADRVENSYGRAERAAAFGIPLIPGVGPLLGVAFGLPNSTVRTAAVDKLSIALSPADSLSFGNVVSLLVHDVEGAATVDAEIGGAPISLVGDKELVTDEVDPITGDHSHKVKSGMARQTFDAATQAVKASLEDLYAAHTAGWFGKKYATVYQQVMGRDRLYTAERLVPQPLGNSLVPPDKRTMPWMHQSVDDFLADPAVRRGLVTWGRVEGPEFEKKLNELKERGELPPKVKDVIQRALIDPLLSEDEQKIVAVLKAILAHR